MDSLATFDQGLHYNDLHNDHKNWGSELQFSLGEIHFFQTLSEKFVSQHGGSAIIEQLQNKLIIQTEIVQTYIHDLKKEEVKLAEFIKKHKQNIEFITFHDHTKWREKMEIHRKLYIELKQEFYQAISEKEE